MFINQKFTKNTSTSLINYERKIIILKSLLFEKFSTSVYRFDIRNDKTCLNSRLCLSKTLLAISSPGLQLISTPATNVSTTWRSIHLLQYVISNSLRKNRPRKSSRWRWFNGRKSPPFLLLHANERNNRDGIVPRMDLSISDEDASSSTGSCAHWCVGTRYRIFEINIQVARREGEKSASLDAACLCVCVHVHARHPRI